METSHGKVISGGQLRWRLGHTVATLGPRVVPGFAPEVGRGQVVQVQYKVSTGDSSAGAGRPRRTFLASVSIGTSAGRKELSPLQAGLEPVSETNQCSRGAAARAPSE